MIETALELASAGLSVIPTHPTLKNPSGRWKQYETRIATPDEIQKQFASAEAIAVIGGNVSGGFYRLDFEGKDHKHEPMQCIYPDFDKMARVELALLGHTELYQQFVIIKTPSNGRHVGYRVKGPTPGEDLASRPSGDLNSKGKPIPNLLIESRGEGMYALVPPSPGYELLQGSLLNIPIVPIGIHEKLVEIAKSFHIEPTKDPPRQAKTSQNEKIFTGKIFPRQAKRFSQGKSLTGISPGDDYNQRGDRHALLTRNGWQLSREDSRAEYWTRPGKPTKDGHSAVWSKVTLGTLSAGHFRVFTTADTDLEEGEVCDLFGLYARLEHNGDFKAAARSLVREGFGLEPKEENLKDFPCENLTPHPKKIVPEKISKKQVLDDDRIPHLTTIANACHARKMQANKILIALQIENEKNCDPLLSDVDLQSIIEKSTPRLHPTRATDIMDADFPEPKWAVPNMIPQGLTLFAGKSKLGKSRLMIGVSVAVALGGKAMGAIQVEQGEVLYCALEDGPGRIQERLDMLCPNGERPEGLYFLTYGQLPGMERGGFNLISSWLLEHPNCRMIVIDTLQKIRPSTTGKRNMYEEDYDTIGQIQGLAMKQGLALVCIHHTNKSKPEYILDEVSGSTGVVGAADTIIILKQTTDGHTLSIVGRDVEAQEKAMRFEDEMWIMLGDQADYQVSEARQQIIDLLRENQEPMSRKEIAQELQKNEWTIRNLMRKMAREKQLIKAGTKYLLYNNNNNDDDDDKREVELL